MLDKKQLHLQACKSLTFMSINKALQVQNHLVYENRSVQSSHEKRQQKSGMNKCEMRIFPWPPVLYIDEW
jgi:hypothetical protein